MSRSITTGLRQRGWTVLVMLLALALLAAPQRASAEEEPGEDNPPVISNGILTPGIVSFEGGSVSIGADVTDDVGVVDVSAEVIGSDGSFRGVGLSPTGGSSYSGSVDIPPNFFEWEVNYSVWVSATDTNGAFTTVVIGDIQVPAPPQFDESPIVSDPSVEPRQLPANGGSVTIQATATDNRSVSAVRATIALPGGGSTEVPLEPISSSRFEGVFAVPANTDTAALQYGVEITAEDDIGQPNSVDAGAITVAGRPVPSAAQLVVRPESRSFGRVWVGRRAWRLVRVRNVGPGSGGSIEGTVQVSGQPFSLPGATPTGIHFRLRPHETEFFLVEFRPSAVGLQAGSLTVHRSDEAQPDFTVQLSGRGIARR